MTSKNTVRVLMISGRTNIGRRGQCVDYPAADVAAHEARGVCRRITPAEERALVAGGTATPKPAATATAETETDPNADVDLKKLGKPALKKMAEAAEIEGFAKMTKPQLIEALNRADDDDDDDDDPSPRE